MLAAAPRLKTTASGSACRDARSLRQRRGLRCEGRLDRIDDFIVTLILADGTRRTFRRDGDVPEIEIRDPLAAHKNCSSATPTPTCTTSRLTW